MSTNAQRESDRAALFAAAEKLCEVCAGDSDANLATLAGMAARNEFDETITTRNNLAAAVGYRYLIVQRNLARSEW